MLSFAAFLQLQQNIDFSNGQLKRNDVKVIHWYVFHICQWSPLRLTLNNQNNIHYITFCITMSVIQY